MRCTECNYALWNLKARQCPECGTPFQPSEFEFVCNSVQFCCLHCDQPYYGTGQRGHLVPQSFECVKCGQHTHMNEMVLRPGEGLREEQTNVDHNPWLNRARVGRMKAFWSSIGMALVGPFRMMRATPQESSVAKPFWFMLIVVTLSTFVGMIPTICMLGLFSFTGSAGTGTGIALRTTGLMLLLFFLGSVAFVLVFCIIWGLTAHGLLKVTGETAGGLGRTFHAIFYGGGAYVMTAIPCAGRYVGIPWWVVSSTLMLKEGQRVHGGRAAFAGLTFPVLSIVLIVGGYSAWVYSMVSAVQQTGFASMGATITVQGETRLVASALYGEATSRADGFGPEHALEMAPRRILSPGAFLSANSNTFFEDIPIANGTLRDFSNKSHSGQLADARAEARKLPQDVVAHRVGDFVFTYHGIDFHNADPALWTVVLIEDPDSLAPDSSGNDPIWIGLADSRVMSIPRSQLQQSIAGQNQVRRVHGLPPLPDLRNVRHRNPGRGQ